jgi:hypothetical protein
LSGSVFETTSLQSALDLSDLGQLDPTVAQSMQVFPPLLLLSVHGQETAMSL